jgi:hypothetical protein
MQEQPYPEYGLSEDTRHMLDPTQNAIARHQMAVFDLIDENLQARTRTVQTETRRFNSPT